MTLTVHLSHYFVRKVFLFLLDTFTDFVSYETVYCSTCIVGHPGETDQDFAELRDTPVADLTDPSQRLIRQFLLGDNVGPLTDSEGMSEYEKLIVTGGLV